MNFDPLCQQIGYQFRDPELLRKACTHKSYSNERNVKDAEDNERLEFLGDAVLDLVISDQLMDHFPQLPEGGLTKLRAGLVSEAGLCKIAKSIDLGQYLLLGKGEAMTGGREKKSILSSTVEAVIAAIYLDRKEEGLSHIKKVIVHLFREEFPTDIKPIFAHDFKTELQEYVQKTFHSVVTYKLIKASGPDHCKEFEVGAIIESNEYSRGIGSSKKEAEQNAANAALSIIFEKSDRIPPNGMPSNGMPSNGMPPTQKQ